MASSACEGPADAVRQAQVSTWAPCLQHLPLAGGGGWRGTCLCPARRKPNSWELDPKQAALPALCRGETGRKEKRSSPLSLRHHRGKKASLNKKYLVKACLILGTSDHLCDQIAPLLPAGKILSQRRSLTLLTEFPGGVTGSIACFMPLCLTALQGGVPASFQWVPAAVSLYFWLLPSAGGFLFSLPATALSLLFIWLL